ncbi:Arm DNA-binding domain-containing protein [Phyllobacterium salinisoli]|uniref:Arm DNA-binding domain-containing protein n=1 Tax=Phyllobacterium salinisoli TaxID=1899321 RepID=UPI0013573F16
MPAGSDSSLERFHELPKIGRYPDVPLADARGQAAELRRAVAKGTDPVADKRAYAASQPVTDLVEWERAVSPHGLAARQRVTKPPSQIAGTGPYWLPPRPKGIEGSE